MEDDSDCVTALTWKHEGQRKVGRPRTTWRRTVEKERKSLVGNLETKLKELPETEGAGKSALQPYGPQGPKRIGEVRYELGLEPVFNGY